MWILIQRLDQQVSQWVLQLDIISFHWQAFMKKVYDMKDEKQWIGSVILRVLREP